MTNPQPRLLTTDLFGTYREAPPKPKAGKRGRTQPAAVPVEAPVPVTDPELDAFRMRSAPFPAPKPMADLLGVEALAQVNDASRLKANELARQIVASEGELTDTARAALRAWSGEGGLGGSTTAFYTPRAVVDLAWGIASALEPGYRALEFSCGGGAFLARAPKGTELTGVEMDETTARIAQALFPHVSVHAAPFERYHAQSEDALFDLVIGNSPYGVRGSTARLDRPRIDQAHWYFLFAGLERLRAGGLMALIVPEAMLRNPSEQPYRQELLEAAHVLTASVLPEDVFRATGAGVTTVLLVLRKHDAGVLEQTAALTAEERTTLLNARLEHDASLTAFVKGESIFRRNAKGEWERATRYRAFGDYKATVVRPGRYGDPIYAGEFKPEVLEYVIQDAQEEYARILTRAGLEAAVHTLLGEEPLSRVRAVKRQGHPIREGQLSPDHQYRFSRGAWGYDSALANPVTLSALGVAQAVVAARTALRAGSSRAPAARQKVAALDQAHQRQYGAYDLTTLSRAAKTLPVLNVLVKGNGDVNAILADLPTPRLQITSGSLSEIAQQLEAFGVLNEQSLTEYANVPPAAIHSVLRADYAFTGHFWESNATYYQGHAYVKATAAETLADRFQGVRREALLAQADRLRKDAPWVDVAAMTLEPRDPLIPEYVLTEWVNTLLGTKQLIKRNTLDQVGEPANLLYASRGEHGVSLRLRNAFDDKMNLAERQVVPTGRVKALEAYLNFRTPVDAVMNQDVKTPEVIAAERNANQMKAVRYERELAAHFRSFVLQGEYAGAVESALNEGRYALLSPCPDPRPLLLPEYQGPLAHPFQAGHVRTAARMSGLIVDFSVGLGKTLTAYMLACLLRQTGRAKLPAMVVPLSRLGDWIMNAATAVPGLRTLVIGGEPVRDAAGQIVLNEEGEPEVREDNGAKRRAKVASLVSDPPDLVIFSAEAFEAIPMLETTRLRYVEGDATLMTGLATMDSFDDRHRKMGGHRELKSFERFVQRHLGRVGIATDSEVPFEATGIDAVLIDEAHLMKNTYSAPTVYGESNPKFLGGGGESNRALDGNHKCRYVRQQGGCTAAFTATFFKNSPIEIYNMLSLITDDLHKYGVTDIGSFVARFCVIEPRLITLPEGDVEYKPCVVGFRNLDELRAMLSQHTIRETEESCQMHDRVGMGLPPLVQDEHRFQLAPLVQARYDAEQATLGEAQSEGEKHLFSIFGRLLKLTLHPPLLNVDAPNARFAECVQACVAARARGGRNVVFMYTGGPDGRTYMDLKAMLVAAGYPEREIEIVTASTHKAGDRLKAERRFRRGETTCVIGSSVIEQGGNYQGGTDLHHMDYPHDYQSFIQRIGRCRRQGTTVQEIHNHLYFALGSFDAIRFQNMLGKRGWSEQVYDLTLKSCENTQVGFDGEEIAVMLARDPEAMRAAIRVKREARSQEARAATLLADASVIREYLETLTLLDKRHRTAQGREKGPSVQDTAGINRLVTTLRTLHGQVQALREAGHPLTAVTRLKVAPMWVEGLPLHVGMTVACPNASYLILSASASRGIFKAVQDGHTVELATTALHDLKDVMPTLDEAAYGEEAFLRLPVSLQERVMGQDAPSVNITLPVIEAAPETVASSMSAVVAPLRLRYGLSVTAAAQPRASTQVFSIQGDQLVAGEVEGLPLVLVEFRAERDVRQVTLVLPEERQREHTRRLLLAQDPRVRGRVDHLLATAV